MEVGGRTLRKRRRPSQDKDAPDSSSDHGLSTLLTLAKSWRRVVVVSGSGLSASSGMSTFSTPGGLYERAASSAKLANGKSLFCWSFFERRRTDCLAFLADVHAEAAAARPTRGHRALGRLAKGGVLMRNFTLNIDGLSERAGMKTWRLEEDPDFGNSSSFSSESDREGEVEGKRGGGKAKPSSSRSRSASLPLLSPLPPPLDPRRGITVELHGNVNELVCPDCHRVTPMTETALAALRARVDLPCVGCPGGVVSDDDDDENENNDGDKKPPPPPSSSFEQDRTGGPLRLRVMLYDDAQGDAITPDEVLDLLESDVASADAVLWVGLSFEQSATTSYFRRVRAALASVGRVPGAPGKGIGSRDAPVGAEKKRNDKKKKKKEDSSSLSRSPSPSRVRRNLKQPCLQAIINPAADDAAFNLLSSCHNRDGIDVLEVRCSADVALAELAKVMGCGGDEEGGEEERVKKEATTATEATTAAVAADASAAAAAASAPPPPPTDQQQQEQAALDELLRARDAPRAPVVAVLPQLQQQQKPLAPPSVPVLAPRPVEAAFDSAPPLSAGEIEDERRPLSSPVSAPVAPAPAAVSPAVAAAAAAIKAQRRAQQEEQEQQRVKEQHKGERIRLTCESVPEYNSQGGDDEAPGFFGRGGLEH